MEKQSRTSKYILAGFLLSGIIILAFWIRVQGISQLTSEQFTEHGTLPKRDMHRWLPLGRDNTQLLSLYAYAIAYIHRVLPWLSLYHIQLYLPVLSFIMGISVLFVFLNRIYGILFATIAGVLLATLPGSIEHSAAGFGDRDAFCLMFAIIAVTSYLWKIQMELGPRRYILTVLSGISVFLGGLLGKDSEFFC